MKPKYYSISQKGGRQQNSGKSFSLEDRSFTMSLVATGVVALLALIIVLNPSRPDAVYQYNGAQNPVTGKADTQLDYSSFLQALEKCEVFDFRLDEYTSCSMACETAGRTCISTLYISPNNQVVKNPCKTIVDPSKYAKVYCTCC